MKNKNRLSDNLRKFLGKFSEVFGIFGVLNSAGIPDSGFFQLTTNFASPLVVSSRLLRIFCSKDSLHRNGITARMTSMKDVYFNIDLIWFNPSSFRRRNSFRDQRKVVFRIMHRETFVPLVRKSVNRTLWTLLFYPSCVSKHFVGKWLFGSDYYWRNQENEIHEVPSLVIINTYLNTSIQKWPREKQYYKQRGD